MQLPFSSSKSTRDFVSPAFDLLRLVGLVGLFLRYSLPPAYIKTGSFTVTLALCGGHGLQLWFFLSSYLVARHFLSDLAIHGQIDLKAFYYRRVIRFLPAYFGILLLAATCYKETHIPTGGLTAYTLLSANWYFYFFGSVPSIIEPLWPLSLGAQFYLVWPWLIQRFTVNPIARAAYCIFGASVISNFILGALPKHQLHAATSTISQGQFFALGALAAVRLQNSSFVVKDAFRIPLTLLSLAALYEGHIFISVTRNGITFVLAYFLVGVAVSGLFLSFYGWQVPAFLRPFVSLGRMTYSLVLIYPLSNHLLLIMTESHLAMPTYAVVLASFSLAVVLASILHLSVISFLDRKGRNYTHTRARLMKKAQLHDSGL